MRAAFFDLDKTVIARASVVAFGGPLRRRGLVNRRTVARAVLGQLLFLWFGADEEKMAKIRQSMLEVSAGCLMCPRLERTASDFERVMLISPGAAGGLAGAGGAARRSGALKGRCAELMGGPAKRGETVHPQEPTLNATTGVIP